MSKAWREGRKDENTHRVEVVGQIVNAAVDNRPQSTSTLGFGPNLFRRPHERSLLVMLHLGQERCSVPVVVVQLGTSRSLERTGGVDGGCEWERGVRPASERRYGERRERTRNGSGEVLCVDNVSGTPSKRV